MSTNQVYALIAAVSAGLGAFVTAFAGSGHVCECPEVVVVSEVPVSSVTTENTAGNSTTVTTNSETTTESVNNTNSTSVNTGTTTSN